MRVNEKEKITVPFFQLAHVFFSHLTVSTDIKDLLEKTQAAHVGLSQFLESPCGFSVAAKA